MLFFYARKNMAWYEDDKLWEMFYECMFDEESFIQAQEQIPELLSLVSTDVCRVLDLGCGPGRHCLALAKMGYEVTGVDTSAFLLSRAKEKALKSNLSVKFIRANMLDFKSDKKFDLIVNMFNSFGYFDTQEDNQMVLNTAYENLADKGTLLLDTVGKETLARTIQPVHLSEYENGDIRIERPVLIENMQIFSNQWMLIRGDKVFTRDYQHFVYTPMELSQMCYQAGFKQVDCYGSLQADTYDLASDRLVVVAQK